jgi:hypothetical protein
MLALADAVSCNFGGSRRVLATAMDDGQGLLPVSVPSTSLRPWVQQELSVALVTEFVPNLCSHKCGKSQIWPS